MGKAKGRITLRAWRLGAMNYPKEGISRKGAKDAKGKQNLS